MTLSLLLQVLTTASSEVSHKTLFKSRSKRYAPDLFFIIFYFTLFLFSGILDISFMFCAFIFEKDYTLGGSFLGIIIFSGIFEFALDVSADDCLPNLKTSKFFRFCMSITGFFAVINSSRLCSEIFMTTMKTSNGIPLKRFTYPFFYVSSNSMSAVKIHCFVCSALKSLPKLFIVPIFIMQNNYNSIVGLLGGVVIVLNMVVFSFTMAITFPLRITPRVFTSSICIPFSAFNKFMAAMCSCCVILAIFASAFNSIRYYALLIPVVRWFTWAWPCWKTLRSQTFRLSTFCFLIYFLFLTFFSSFIYIHPFEGVGKLHYYIFYFLEFLEEIILIYMFTDVSLDHVTSYLVFRIVMIGFLSIFGVTNILHKYKEEKTKGGCLSYEVNVMSQGLDEVEELSEERSVEEKENIKITQY